MGISQLHVGNMLPSFQLGSSAPGMHIQLWSFSMKHGEVVKMTTHRAVVQNDVPNDFLKTCQIPNDFGIVKKNLDPPKQMIINNWLVVWNIFHFISRVILPIDFHIFQDG